MTAGLLGKKLGMTRVFDDEGQVRPVTVVEAGPCAVLRTRTAEEDGYRAVQLGFELVYPDRLTKPMRGMFQVLGSDAYAHVAEFRTEEELPEAGTLLTVAEFEPGTRVHVRGVTKGRGFQGVMKRHGFHGGRASHGSNFHRAPGSIGTASTPGRVWKGRKLPGQMGSVPRTVRNLEIVQVDPERNVLLIAGGLPGAKNSIVKIMRAA